MRCRWKVQDNFEANAQLWQCSLSLKAFLGAAQIQGCPLYTSIDQLGHSTLQSLE